MNIKLYRQLFLVTLAFSPFAHAGLPASIEYVNQKISELEDKLTSLRSELIVKLSDLPGEPGPQGPQGNQGIQGVPGPTGAGVPTGGLTNQMLVKQSPANFDTAWVDTPSAHYIGENALGGVVFWVDSSKTHGLVAAKIDQNTSIEWFNDKWLLTNALGDGIGAGKSNTTLIVSQQTYASPNASMAALDCINFKTQASGEEGCSSEDTNDSSCYADWYLPSSFELKLMHTHADVVPGVSSNIFWSSTEFSRTDAFLMSFANGVISHENKLTPHAVRCIRAF
jgi:hypothetical protein